MGSVLSAAAASPRWANALASLLLLWRTQAVALVRARGASYVALRRLVLMSLLLVSSRGRVWRYVREATGLPLLAQRLAILFVLQRHGNMIPLIAVLVSASSGIFAAARESLPPLWPRLGLPALVSGSLMYFLHEAPHCVTPAYVSFLRVVSGPSRPVLGKAAAAAAAGPLLPALASAAARALRPAPLAAVARRSYVYNLRSFFIFYCVVRPALRRKAPKKRDAVQAARTALWVTLAGLIGSAAGSFELPGRPLLTTAVRVSLGAAGAVTSLIDPEHASRPILAFLGAQMLFAYIKSAEGALRVRRSAIGRALSVAYPLAGLLNIVRASSLTGVVIKAL